jgi:ATP-dependent Clp protease ATP-binding subunit ClpX
MVVATPSRALELYEATERVVGQERARRQMAVILDGQWRVAQGIDQKQAAGVLLGGFSGSGKTMILRMMCSHLGLPYAETDATRYAEVGYKGLQLPQMFIPLLREAARMKDAESPAEDAEADPLVPSWALKVDKKDGQEDVFKREDIDEVVARAEVGVVVLDEFDKWMQRTNHFSGQKDTAIQSEFLKMLEGSREWVSQVDDMEVGVTLDTSKVLIICAGAFVGLYQQVRARLREDADPKAQQMDENFWNAIVPEDFERFGLLPELAGRLSRHIFTRPLQEHHLIQILTAPGGVLAHYRDRYEACGVRWDVDEAGVRWLVGEAKQHKTGARALDHVAHKFLGGDVLFEAATADMPMAVRINVNTNRAVLVPLR